MNAPDRQQQLLEQLAMRAQRFTPRVSLAPPDGLLLEVKGSLHLFGGMEDICPPDSEEHRAAGGAIDTRVGTRAARRAGGRACRQNRSRSRIKRI